MSCRQDETTLRRQFSLVESYFTKYYCSGQKYLIAPYVVCDCSYAIINCVLKEFNGCKLIGYLMWSFDVVVNKKFELSLLLKTRLLVCSIHYLRNMIKQTKKIFGNANVSEKDGIAVKAFLFCVTLLQNCESIEEFLDNFKCMFFVFCSKQLNLKTVECLAALRDNIATRKLSHKGIYGIFSNFLIENIGSSNLNLIIRSIITMIFIYYKIKLI